MSEEKTGAVMAITTTKPASSTQGAKVFAGLLATISSQPLAATSFPTPTTSLSTTRASISSLGNTKFSPNMAEATTSDPTTASLPHLTPFPDLNFQTATLLARLKNPSLLSTEELKSATSAANATLSAWKKELLAIDASKGRERRRKLGPQEEMRPKDPKTSREEKESVWKDWNDGEEGLRCARKGTVANTSREPSADLGPPPTASSSSSRTAEESQKGKGKVDKAAKHSAKMREVWAKRRAEGTNGRKGGQPLPRTVKRWTKVTEKKEVD